MQWLKALLLTILGFFRVQGNKAVDLRYAGAEQSARIKASIEDLRTQRDEIAAKGVILEGKIKKAQENVDRSIKAVKHHAEQGNDGYKQKAYNDYQEYQAELDRLTAEEAEINQQVKTLDADIKRLEEDARGAANALDKAATNQLLGKARNKVEDIHGDIKHGALAEAIEGSEQQSAVGEVKRRSREAADNSDVYKFEKVNNVKSMDEILGNTTKVE